MLRLAKRNVCVRSLTAFSGLVLLAAGGAGRPEAFAQVRAKPSEASLQHEVTVTLKLIQVFVTDASGKPALDLERSDFVLTDNGKPQAITEFERHILAVPAAERAVAVPAPASSPETAAPLLSRRFIFLIDYIRNGFEGVQKAKAAALQFLDTKVGPEDVVGLFTLSTTSGLTLLVYLTTDHGKVRSALKKLRDLPGSVGDLPRGDLMGMELLNADVFAPHGGHAGPTRRNVFADIAEWAKSLRAIPGQKNIILFTEGFGNDVVRPGRLDNVLFEMMAKALATANAPVFTVDTTPQVPPSGPVDAKLASGTLAENSLAYLSRTTGGMFMGHVNFSARIATVIQDATANYYVLGYSIPAAWDGKYHDVKVEVRRPGYTVHAQRGYFNPVPFAKLSPIEKHLHLIEVALAEGASAKRNRNFPLKAVQFAGVEEGDTLLLSEIPLEFRESIGDRVELISLILDRNNAIIDGKRIELDWQNFRSARVFQYSTASLAPGRYDCRSVIRNLDDGRAAVGSCSIDVASVPAGGPAIFPPFFLVRGPEAQYLNVASQGKGGGEAGLSISNIFPFPAKEYVPLVGALEQGSKSLFASLRCIWGEERRGKGEMELAARLTPEGREEGEPIEMTLLASESLAEADFYLLEFELPDLAPGRCRLEIQAEDANTGLIVSSTGQFTVRPPSSSVTHN